MRKLSLLAVLAVLPACARLYVPPTGDLGSYAKITLRNVSPVVLETRLYDDPVACTGWVKLDEKDAGIATGQTQSFYAKKGEPVTVGAFFVYKFYGGFRRCNLAATIVPTAAAYVVSYDTDAEAKKCGALWTEGEGKSAKAVAKGRFVSRKWNTPFLQSGSWCQELTAEQRVALGLPAAPAAPAAAAVPASAETAAE